MSKVILSAKDRPSGPRAEQASREPLAFPPNLSYLRINEMNDRGNAQVCGLTGKSIYVRIQKLNARSTFTQRPLILE